MAVNLVWGLGLTGWSAICHLNNLGKQVLVYSDNFESEYYPLVVELIGEKNIINKLPKPAELKKFDRIIVSPGISCWDPRYQAIKRLGLNISTDIDLFLEFFRGKTIAVTGTNGKSTMVAKLAHIASKCGIDAIAAGNIGHPCLAVPDSTELVILELSSYHLAHGISSKIDLGFILEIQPDHIDWHKSYVHYKYAKHKLNTCAKICYMQKDDKIIDTFGKFVGHTKDLISIIAKQQGWVGFQQHLASFQALEHRQQVIEHAGRTWVNDSKATNAAATMYAISCYSQQRPVLILAGQHKGIPTEVAAIILIGRFADWPINTNNLSTYEVANLNAAIKQALALSTIGGLILFSPGGASFDQFKNFADRGNKFMEQVLCLE